MTAIGDFLIAFSKITKLQSLLRRFLPQRMHHSKSDISSLKDMLDYLELFSQESI